MIFALCAVSVAILQISPEGNDSLKEGGMPDMTTMGIDAGIGAVGGAASQAATMAMGSGFHHGERLHWEAPLISAGIGAASNVAAGQAIHHLDKQDSPYVKGAAHAAAGMVAPALDHLVFNEDPDLAATGAGAVTGAAFDAGVNGLVDYFKNKKKATPPP